jgi:integrative and conjugative element protein (TIGR02256 family)
MLIVAASICTTVARFSSTTQTPETWARGTFDAQRRHGSRLVGCDHPGNTAVKRAMRTHRSRRLPNETGGVLLGAFDLERKLVFVSDVLGSPEDSREWPSVYIRGSAGLRSAVQDAERLTQGGLEYVGEWHSHPNGVSGDASSTDKRALRLLSEGMGEDARPAVMFIVAEKEIRTYVEESESSSQAEDPS